MDWLGQVEYQKTQYEQNWTVAKKLDSLWQEDAVSAVVLKGRAIAQYYEKPELRYSCDLDVFIPDGSEESPWRRACERLEREGVKLKYDIYKESEFTIDGVYVECHRVITPIRGNKRLQMVEKYLRLLLAHEEPRMFEGTTLRNPPLMFTVMLWVEHALGDLLKGHLTVKHLVDWVILRRQLPEKISLESRCKEFGFDKFLKLADALADMLEGKCKYGDLPKDYRMVYDTMMKEVRLNKHENIFWDRVQIFFELIENSRMFRKFGYCSMTSFLWNAVWSHFFEKDLKQI